MPTKVNPTPHTSFFLRCRNTISYILLMMRKWWTSKCLHHLHQPYSWEKQTNQHQNENSNGDRFHTSTTKEQKTTIHTITKHPTNNVATTTPTIIITPPSPKTEDHKGTTNQHQRQPQIHVQFWDTLTQWTKNTYHPFTPIIFVQRSTTNTHRLFISKYITTICLK